MQYIYTQKDPINVAKIGGKSASLAKMNKGGFTIPEWFAISPQAFLDSLTTEQKEMLQDHRVEEVFAKLEINQKVKDEISKTVAKLGLHKCKMAVRSSGVIEDGKENSFAGQFESYLWVTEAELFEYVKKVWHSGFSERIFEYYKQRDIDPLFSSPAVLVQKMVNADKAGVIFSVDPVEYNPNKMVLSVTKGVGDKLMTGEVDGDTYYLSRKGEILKSDLIEDNHPILSKSECKQVGELAVKVEKYFQSPQDIEWAIENKKVYLLQSRPITTIKNASKHVTTLWDNSNIVESYSGIVSPLTFSFASTVYSAVYKRFSEIMGVPRSVISENLIVYDNFLGFINGRMYYNLLNWYKMIMYLPGFTLNSKFMEQMMGVSEPLPDKIMSQITIKTYTTKDKLIAWYRLIISSVQSLYQFIRLEQEIKYFFDLLQKTLSCSSSDIENMTLDELGTYFRNLEKALINNWNAPLINDFYCMIFFGLSRKLLNKYLGKEGEELHNSFLKHQGNMISAEPAKRIKQMAKVAAKNSALLDALKSENQEKIVAAIKADKEFSELYYSYLDKFADRCLQELKLESLTLDEDPSTFQNTILTFALSNNTNDHEEESDDTEPYNKLNSMLSHKPIMLAVTKWVIKHAVRLVRNRENLRFERTRLFGTIRKISIATGKKLLAMGKLEHYRDIFYLELDEILGMFEGRLTTLNLKNLVAIRKEEAANYENMEDPPQRFFITGAVSLSFDNIVASRPEADTSDPNVRKGIGCCPGILRGKVRVIHNPKEDMLAPGEILVAKFTDPGWIMLFANASGILVERGSLLSHSAIVAREMGIPAVVSVHGLMEWLKTGDEVEFDGATGVITRIIKE
ncbi:MAG: phosphoenolpyruvate synthase [Alphaproteobacteria bacterium]|nr:phosphoenolpyruvate synthase [Alphaproteobacteria bacterium]